MLLLLLLFLLLLQLLLWQIQTNATIRTWSGRWRLSSLARKFLNFFWNFLIICFDKKKDFLTLEVFFILTSLLTLFLSFKSMSHFFVVDSRFRLILSSLQLRWVLLLEWRNLIIDFVHKIFFSSLYSNWDLNLFIF